MNSGVAVAIAVGTGVAVQVAILGRAAGELHPLATSLALQLAGVLAATAWATSRDGWSDVLATGLRWWCLPLGIGGWLVVAALGYAGERIGVAATLALSVGAQLVVGRVIDVATGGTAAIAWRPTLGVVLVVAGTALVASAA